MMTKTDRVYEKNIIHIDDDFDLEKIRVSGQCFRVRRMENDTYRFIFHDNVVYVKEFGEGNFEISCSLDEWKRIWAPYFDLERNYSTIRASSMGKANFIDKSIEAGSGLRVLNQDAFEMLITFIISQRKSIPAISTAVEALCTRFGKKITGRGEEVFAFPEPSTLAQATEDELRACGLGYRAPYVADAARRVAAGDLDLEGIRHLDDQELFEKLQEVHGVGKKVSNCVCLFAYGRSSLVPVDVWIQRAIDNECNGIDPFVQFGNEAGIIQQYVFYYMTQVARAR